MAGKGPALAPRSSTFPRMANLVGIAGSLRKGSLNAALLRAAAALAPAGTVVDVASIAGIPVYDGDVDRDAFPEAVVALGARIAAADGLLLVTPEYNNSIPGGLKNAIDWLSRPVPATRQAKNHVPRPFSEKPVAILGASIGPGGTRLAQAAWLPVFRMLGARLWSGKVLYLASATQAFDAEGKLVDEKARKTLEELMAGFAAFAKPGA